MVVRNDVLCGVRVVLRFRFFALAASVRTQLRVPRPREPSTIRTFREGVLALHATVGRI